jgi:hypothetical protein
MQVYTNDTTGDITSLFVSPFPTTPTSSPVNLAEIR